MSNSKLFTDAHKMTKLTIQPNDVYRYKFGQWLIFLKTGITNVLRLTNINQSVCYVPILEHDIADKVFISPFTTKKLAGNKYTYKMSLPLTLTRSKQSGYSESYYLGKMLLSSGFIAIAIIIMQFMLILKFI